ncbi:MAG TPA: FHA domain-containing protein, partial [Kofleriaceae bacterium]|nr:FHA domain-containing protein [Kofleriaceae bacterium]
MGRADDLGRRIPATPGLVPEQIGSPAESDSTAVLIDQWSRAHRLHRTTVLGREPPDTGIAIREASVSRRHAEIRLDGDAWVLADLGSTNGTSLDGLRIRGPVTLADRQLIGIGDVGFAFVRDQGSLRARTVTSVPTAPAQGRVDLLRLVEPSGGGGGLVYQGERCIQLGLTQ